MSKLLSVAMTTDAVIERRKTVTRRTNWWEDKNGRRLLKVGDTLTLCRKVQGRKPGEPIDRLAEVEVIDIRREQLAELIKDRAYGSAEVEREGFPGMAPIDFVDRYFLQSQGIAAHDVVTRIAWRYLDDCIPCAESATCDDCEERLCSVNGPEPRPCGTTCTDCPCSCQKCLDARADLRTDLANQIDRDSRTT